MKRGYLYNSIIAFFSATVFFSCNSNNGVETVKVTEPGTLSEQRSGSQWDKIKNLAIEGPLNEIDIAFLKSLDCHGLESLDLSKAEKMKDIHFFFDSNLFSSITLPDNVESIEDESFQGCLNLKEIKVSPQNPNFKLIDGVLYSADTSRIVVYPTLLPKKTYTIPAKVKQISNCLFAAATELENIEVDSNNKTFISKDGILYTKDSTFLISYPAGKKNTTFVLPKEVIKVNWSAFWGAYNLKAINVDSNNNFFTSNDGLLLEKNNNDADCNDFTLVAFPAGKKSSAYKLPQGITQINTCALKTCTIDTLVLNKDLFFIDKWAFNGAKIKYFEVEKENISYSAESGILYKGNSAYLCPTDLEGDITIRPTTSIDERAFQRGRLSSLKIGQTLVTGPFFCSYCNQLKEVYFENGIKETNGLGAFFCCAGLEKVDLPESFEKINNRMFFGCINLQTLICRAKKAPAIDKYAFTGVDLKRCIVYVPAESIEDYRKNDDWKKFVIKPIINQ